MQWTPALLYEADGDRLRCTLCPLRCGLRDGRAGACNVRRRNGDALETATFATSTRHVDSIERKPLYHFRPGTKAVTLAAPGCTFRCGYCVNHRMSQFGRDERSPWTARPVDPGDVVAQAAAEGAAVALSYTEPSLAIELTLALADEGDRAGVPVLWKSNGFVTGDALALVASRLAAVNLDLKAAEEEPHRRLTGQPLRPVLDALAGFAAAGTWVEVSTPLIPGTSADPGQLARIADLIATVDPDIPWHLLRWTPAYQMRDDDPTTPEALADAVRIGRAAGLRHVYVERALGPDGRATFCRGCGHPLIRRGIWSLDGLDLHGGACPRCTLPLPGRW